jgi:hypothetical protein
MKRNFAWMAAVLSAGVMAAAAQTTTAVPQAAAALPPAPGAAITNLTPKPGFYTEPGVSVNPLNPRQVVVVFQDNAQAAYSDDSGNTWHLAPGVTPDLYRVSGDVSTVFDNQGHAFMACISFDKLGAFNYWAQGAIRNSILLRRSLDGGKTWEPEVRTVIAQPTRPGIPFEDKPYLVADTSKQSRFAGNLYIGWTRWTIADSQMLFTRSTDDGLTWSTPIELSAQHGLPRDDNGALEGFDGAVAPDGTLYAVWALNDHIVMVESHDGGKTFSKTRNIVWTAPTMFAIAGMDRANGFPQIAIDPRGGKKGGPIYVTWSDYRNGDVDVFLIVSRDHGKSWSAPVRVNDDPLHDGADHFFQWLAVDPVSGAVNVVFYDQRTDPRYSRPTVVLARSEDGGQTFKNYAWMQSEFDPRGVFMGDYLGLAAWGNRVYGAWPVRVAGTHGTLLQVGVADFGAGSTSPKNPQQ